MSTTATQAANNGSSRGPLFSDASSSSRNIRPRDVFDLVYVINLDRRPERWERTRRAIAQAGGFEPIDTFVRRFSAVDGQNPDVQHEYKQWPMRDQYSAGAYGCTRSHLAIYEEALNAGYERVLILEDDATFHQHFADRFDDLMRVAPDDWHLLLFGFGYGRQRRMFSPSPASSNGGNGNGGGTARWRPLTVPPLGSYAYAITAPAMHFLLHTPMAQLMPMDVGALAYLNQRAPFAGHCWVPNWPHPIVQTVLSSDTVPHSLADRAQQTTYYNHSGWIESDYTMEPPPVPESASWPALPPSTPVSASGLRTRVPRTGTDPVVAVRLVGDLGDRLFVVAAALAYALQYQRTLLLPGAAPGGTTQPRPDSLLMTAWCEPSQAPPHVRCDRLSATADRERGSQLVTERAFHYEPLPPPQSPHTPVFLQGRFHSCRYFEPFWSDVQRAFTPPPTSPLARQVDEVYRQLVQQVGHERFVAVHVQRGDSWRRYPNHRPTLPLSYYRTAVQRGGWTRRDAADPSTAPTLVVFTDDRPWCEQHLTSLSLGGVSVVVSPTNLSHEVILFAMARCRFGLVMANSSDSWWSALLGHGLIPDVPVLAPVPWYRESGPQNTRDLYVPEWQRVAWK